MGTDSSVIDARTWEIPFISKDAVKSRDHWALIVLNTPFSVDLFHQLWVANGGANRVFDLLSWSDRERYLPDIIKGDLDSLRTDVGDYYQANGVLLKRDPDQYSTDLQKSIAAVEAIESPGTQKGIIILGGLSGRLDQTLHTLSALHRLRKERRELFVLTDESVAWVLDKGSHCIRIDRTALGPTCGLMPIGVSSAVITTKGLEWNLSNSLSSFDGLFSTSNHVVDEEVYVETSEPIWWCIEHRISPL